MSDTLIVGIIGLGVCAFIVLALELWEVEG